MNIEFTLTAGSKGRLSPENSDARYNNGSNATKSQLVSRGGGGGASAQFSSQTEIDLQIKLLDKTKRKANY